jgi:hypothetical protein
LAVRHSPPDHIKWALSALKARVDQIAAVTGAELSHDLAQRANVLIAPAVLRGDSPVRLDELRQLWRVNRRAYRTDRHER